jgi:hypothetical protein
MQKKRDLSYFPPNPYKVPQRRAALSWQQQRMIHESWTTRPAWRINLRAWFARRRAAWFPAPPKRTAAPVSNTPIQQELWPS